jgi:two-component system cell cycle response regulator DivK
MSNKPNLLVVEDNADNQITVKAILAEAFEIIEANDGKTGVEKALKYHPDLVLMDISLPVMDGIQALKAIKNEPDTRSIPVIALTARAMTGDREDFLSYGFDGYVSKPINPEELDQVIRRCLNGD